MSDRPDTLAAALAQLQTKLPEIRKSEVANVQTTKGAYSYTYANLAGISAQIMPLLGELGLSFIAKPTFSDGRFVLAYSLLHASGQREDGEYPLPTSGTPQAIGSAITYGRRYCLCSVTGVAPEDDDDGAAAEAEKGTHRGTAQRAAAPPRTPTPTRPQAQRASRPPAPPPPLPADEPDTYTPSQRAKIMALFGQAGVVDRTERLELSSRIINRRLASANDMTKDDAKGLIDVLDTASGKPDPLAYLREVTAAMPIDGEGGNDDWPDVPLPPDGA